MIFVEIKCWILTFKVRYNFLQVTLYIIQTCKCMLKVNTAFVKQCSGKPREALFHRPDVYFGLVYRLGTHTFRKDKGGWPPSIHCSTFDLLYHFQSGIFLRPSDIYRINHANTA